jgi:hypothetical protein
MEARHPEFADALQGDDDVIVDGEPVNPRLHVAMHQVVANQLLADDPPESPVPHLSAGIRALVAGRGPLLHVIPIPSLAALLRLCAAKRPG